MLPLLSSSRAYVFLPCMLWALCHMAPLGLAASCGVGTSVANDLLSVRVYTPSPDALCVFRRALAGLWEATHLSDGVFACPDFQRAASTSPKADA